MSAPDHADDATRTSRPDTSDLAGRWHQRITRVYPLETEVALSLVITGRTVSLGRDEARVDVALPDGQASRRHATLSATTAYGVHRIIDQDSKNGTFVNGRRIEDPQLLRDGDVFRIGDTLFVYESLEVTDVELDGCPTDVALRQHRALTLAERAAAADLPVLLTGPTGAGKEVTAQRIHQLSGRSGPFVAVNCAALSPELLASELFGHVTGAFSGARSGRAGLFRTAAGGTLLLDEVGDMPREQQPALLRVLQERRVRPVGADRDEVVDVRVVAATHQDLAARQQSGAFREDLLARLSTLVVPVPALRDRKVELLSIFLAMSKTRSAISLGAAEALLSHDWPQNFRELQQLAAQLDVLAEPSPRVERAQLPPRYQPGVEAGGEGSGRPAPDQIEAALAEHRGNVTAAARALGVHRNQLYRWLDGYGIDPTRFRT